MHRGTFPIDINWLYTNDVFFSQPFKDMGRVWALTPPEHHHRNPSFFSFQLGICPLARHGFKKKRKRPPEPNNREEVDLQTWIYRQPVNAMDGVGCICQRFVQSSAAYTVISYLPQSPPAKPVVAMVCCFGCCIAA